MRLFKEIGGNLLGNVAPCGRCLLFVGEGGYFQGVKSVESFSERGVILRFSCGELSVKGERLCVGKYRDGDVELRGKIFELSYSAQVKAKEKSVKDAPHTVQSATENQEQDKSSAKGSTGSGDL